MRRVYFILLIGIMSSCGQEELSREAEFIGSWELLGIELWDENFGNLEGYMDKTLPAGATIQLDIDGSYLLEWGHRRYMPFAWPSLRGLGPNDLSMGIWEATELGFYLHFDRGSQDGICSPSFDGPDLLIMETNTYDAELDLLFQKLGYEHGKQRAIVSNASNDTDEAAITGMYLGFAEGYVDLWDQYEDYDYFDSFLVYYEGFAIGFHEIYANANNLAFQNAFNAAYDENYGLGVDFADSRYGLDHYQVVTYYFQRK